MVAVIQSERKSADQKSNCQEKRRVSENILKKEWGSVEVPEIVISTRYRNVQLRLHRDLNFNKHNLIIQLHF